MIIDVRNNHGGYQNTGQYIISFFFSQEPVLLYNEYTRDAAKITDVQSWTLPYVGGKRRPDVPLYVLTSNFTFSAAEALPYSLQSLKRAVIVGETTGGGAHAWIGKIAADRFYVHLPNHYPVDPRTKTDWEGVGVKPDIEVPAKDALVVAHIKALEKLSATDTANAVRFNWHLTAAKSKLNPIVISQTILKSYTGKYGAYRSITFENDKLYFHLNGGKYEMIPMSETLFRIEEINILRVKMVLEAGTVKGIESLLYDGTSRMSLKE
jgi:C-terminal processing protease CtpA/Prc